MDIVVNGKVRSLDAPLTLTEFLHLLELRSDRCAVELNRHIVPRESWPNTVLNDKDQLEIVHFIGGG